MALKQKGKQSVCFENPPVISGAASVVGKKEGEGPFGQYFDTIEEDSKMGADTWEEAEAKFQEKAANQALKNAGLLKKDIRYMVAGDLLGQLMASSFGLMNMEIPLFGVYGACSTMGESLAIASMIAEGDFAEHVLAITSSHFASAEKQFRFPLGYGNQRPKAATWTVTGSGAVVVSRSVRKQELQEKKEYDRVSDRAKAEKGRVKIKGITTGKIVDYGVKDSMNMGACMAPAAGEVITQNLIDFGYQPEFYDKIITGDLGMVGKDILIDYVQARGYDIRKQYMDCGIEIYGADQNTQAGGSGCGCSAVMLAGYILKMLEQGEWQRVLFVPTGALMSQVSFNEGNSVPGIAHAVILERMK
ncbi:MAG: stage V sporulation protein AD [Clostridiaceae bacterium]|nr:stage V sporulation protein AD [Clostridiaceae bacterium]